MRQAVFKNYFRTIIFYVTCERKGTDCIQVHKVTGGAVVSATAQNVDGLGSIPTDHSFFHLDLWAGMSHHLPTSIVRTLRSIITFIINWRSKFSIKIWHFISINALSWQHCFIRTVLNTSNAFIHNKEKSYWLWEGIFGRSLIRSQKILWF